MDGNFPVFDTHPSQSCDTPDRADARRSVALRVIDWLMQVHERARSRRVLALLDDRMLRDIGLDRGTAQFQAEKPFWRG